MHQCHPEDGELAEERVKAEELKSPNSTLRESTRLRNKATMSAKAKQDSSKPQQDSGLPPPPPRCTPHPPPAFPPPAFPSLLCLPANPWLCLPLHIASTPCTLLLDQQSRAVSRVHFSTKTFARRLASAWRLHQNLVQASVVTGPSSTLSCQYCYTVADKQHCCVSVLH